MVVIGIGSEDMVKNPFVTSRALYFVVLLFSSSLIVNIYIKLLLFEIDYTIVIILLEYNLFNSSFIT